MPVKFDNIPIRTFEGLIYPDSSRFPSKTKRLFKYIEVICNRCLYFIAHGKIETNRSLAKHCIYHLQKLNKDGKSKDPYVKDLKILFLRVATRVSKLRSRNVLMKKFELELRAYTDLDKKLQSSPKQRQTVSKNSAPKLVNSALLIDLEGIENIPPDSIEKLLDNYPKAEKALIAAPKIQDTEKKKQWVELLGIIRARNIAIHFKTEQEALTFIKIGYTHIYSFLSSESKKQFLLQGINYLSVGLEFREFQKVLLNLSSFFRNLPLIELEEAIKIIQDHSSSKDKLHNINKLLFLITASAEKENKREVFQKVLATLKGYEDQLSELLKELEDKPFVPVSFGLNAKFMPSRPYINYIEFSNEIKQEDLSLKDLFDRILCRYQVDSKIARSENYEFIQLLCLDFKNFFLIPLLNSLAAYGGEDVYSLYIFIFEYLLEKNDQDALKNGFAQFWPKCTGISGASFLIGAFDRFSHHIKEEQMILLLETIADQSHDFQKNIISRLILQNKKKNQNEELSEAFVQVFETLDSKNSCRTIFENLNSNCQL